MPLVSTNSFPAQGPGPGEADSPTEALLKRVDSLEKRLHEENKDKQPAEKKEDPPIEDFNAPQQPSKPPPPPPPVAQKPSIGINPNANTSTSSISPTDVRYAGRAPPVSLEELC